MENSMETLKQILEKFADSKGKQCLAAVENHIIELNSTVINQSDRIRDLEAKNDDLAKSASDLKDQLIGQVTAEMKTLKENVDLVRKQSEESLKLTQKNATDLEEIKASGKRTVTEGILVAIDEKARRMIDPASEKLNQCDYKGCGKYFADADYIAHLESHAEQEKRKASIELERIKVKESIAGIKAKIKRKKLNPDEKTEEEADLHDPNADKKQEAGKK